MGKLKNTLNDFRAFAVKGNMIDLAVGVIIGGAFGKIVTSLVNDIIMPLLGLLLGRVNLADLSVTLREAEGEVEALFLTYGSFLQNILDFLIIAISIFIIIRLIGKLRRKQEEETPAPPPVPRTEVLLEEIRDMMKEQNRKF